MMDVYGMPHIPLDPVASHSERRSAADLPELNGKRVSVLEDAGAELTGKTEGCTSCLTCAKGCPEDAISVADGHVTVVSGRCMGTACRRCEMNCPETVLKLKALKIKKN